MCMSPGKVLFELHSVIILYVRGDAAQEAPTASLYTVSSLFGHREAVGLVASS